MLHRSGDAQVVNGIHVYSMSSYQTALLVMPCCYLASLILAIWLIRESYPGTK